MPKDQSTRDEQHEKELARIFADLMDKVQQGIQVDLGAECAKHTDFQEELRELWGTIMVTQAVGRDQSATADDLDGVPMPPPFELPASFGPYTLVEEIGRGGMGVVYHAKHEESGRDVALKMILHGKLASETTIKRFRAEAQATIGLVHPNIIRIHDPGQHEGRAYFCMELIEGETLSDRLARGPMPPRQTARLLLQVARAIHFAHENGVLHRDLKPSNILISDEGNQPYVVDFGLARDDSATETLTATGSVIGTPSYMAPEQAAGARGQVGPTSDVYSLGGILYHMLTGRPPFQAASPVDTVLMLLEQDPIAPRVLNRNADRKLEMIAMRCLQKPQDLRYRSAASLADDLEAYLNEESVSAERGRFGHIWTSVMRDTHQASIMENWGLLWMWHSLALFLACLGTQVMFWMGVTSRWWYSLIWIAGFGAWAIVFWTLRRRMGPVTFVERQIAHLWTSSIICIAAIFPLEWYLQLPLLCLAPILSLIAGMVFLVKASILTGVFYFQALALFATAFVMALLPDWALLIFGTVSAACFYFAGSRFYRRDQSVVGKVHSGGK